MRRKQEDCKVVLLEWEEADGIAEVISQEMTDLGYKPLLISPAEQIPREAAYLFTYGPYGKLWPFLAQLDSLPPEKRPVSIHWNTEGIPDLRLPWQLVKTVGLQRSRIEQRLATGEEKWLKGLSQKRPFSHLNLGMKRFRYVGDLYDAYRRGWVHVIADSSQIYAKLRTDHGLPTLFAPWGATSGWYADLHLERDIDVLWMGNRDTRRRSVILDTLRDELRARGLKVYMADNQEAPFIFGEARTELLNRAKITLNVTRTWFDDNFSRFALTAPNRSLLVSEEVLPHCPYFEAGVHYVAASVAQLPDTIVYYLEKEEARHRIVDNCYELITSKLTMRNTIQTMMQAAEQKRS
jgi:hypothetical protein